MAAGTASELVSLGTAMVAAFVASACWTAAHSVNAPAPLAQRVR